MAQRTPADPELPKLSGSEWLLALEDRIGKEADDIQPIEIEDKPKIHVFGFADTPEPGLWTWITSGLAHARHPDWTEGVPELIVTVASDDPGWGLLAGYFAAAGYGDQTFSYGEVLMMDEPFCDGSAIRAGFLFAPLFDDPDAAVFPFADLTVRLTGFYPIHDEELALFDEIGLERFWKRAGWEPFDVMRAPFTTAPSPSRTPKKRR
jgi:hypothetical protein